MEAFIKGHERGNGQLVQVTGLPAMIFFKGYPVYVSLADHCVNGNL